MKIRFVVPALAAAAALTLTGCVNDDSAVKESSCGQTKGWGPLV